MLSLAQADTPANQSKDTLVILYSHKPKPFTWHINGKAVGDDLGKVIAVAPASKTREVIVRSERKLTNQDTYQIISIIGKTKLNLIEFWVPVGDFDENSKTPGWVNLMERS